MFLFSEILHHINRNRGRSLLLVGVAALMVSCIALYTGTMENNQAALKNLSQAIPVTVQVVGPNGQQQIGLEIDTQHMEALLSSDIVAPLYTALASGNLEEKNRVEAVKSCDTQLIGVNHSDALSLSAQERITYDEGWDETVFTGDQPVCIVSLEYAKTHRVSLGDTLRFPLYISKYEGAGMQFRFVEVGEAALQVVGTYQADSDVSAESANMAVPIRWLYSFVENAGIDYTYTSFQATVKNPLQLNAFKAQMKEKHFREVDPDALDARKGDRLQINDQLFIETADGIQGTIAIFRWFQLPFFLLIILLLTFILFLVLRNARKDMAIACSLGRPKPLCALRYFTENMILMLAGCSISLPVLLLFVAPAGIAAIYLLFLACACVGSALALALLLRFDSLGLLTKID